MCYFTCCPTTVTLSLVVHRSKTTYSRTHYGLGFWLNDQSGDTITAKEGAQHLKSVVLLCLVELAHHVLLVKHAVRLHVTRQQFIDELLLHAYQTG